jgi:hypothetical protein
MKYTVIEFAAKIRRLYPGDYVDLPDDRLVELWLRKHPNDRGKVDFPGKPRIKSELPLEKSQKTIVYYRSNWVRQLLFGLALLFLLFLSYMKNPTSDDFIKELELRYQEKFKTELKQEGLMAGILGLFSSGLDLYLNSNYKRSDLLFLSIYHREVANRPKVIAIGFWNNFFFLEEPFSDKTENSDNFKKSNICENTEESLREFLSRPNELWERHLIMEDLSITQDVNQPIVWKIIDKGPNKYEAEAIYMPDDKTFTVIWFH